MILVHRLLKNPVPVREYVLLSEELYGTGASTASDQVHEVAPELEGIGTVRAFYVDVAGLDEGAPPLPAPTWRGRLVRTAYAAGAGLPYMFGRRRRELQGAAGA